MKIAVSGTHSTGKTTLCNELYALAVGTGLNACLINEVARTVFDEHGSSPSDMSRYDLDTTQREIFLRQLRLEDEAEADDYDLIICDRTIMDCIVYARVYGVAHGLQKTFYRIAKYHLTTYDYIAVTKIDLGIADSVTIDGLRDTDRSLWYAIEKGIHEEVTPNTNAAGLRAVVAGLHLRTTRR